MAPYWWGRANWIGAAAAAPDVKTEFFGEIHFNNLWIHMFYGFKLLSFARFNVCVHFPNIYNTHIYNYNSMKWACCCCCCFRTPSAPRWTNGEEKNTEKQLIVIMNNLSKTNDALRMIMEPNMEIGISYLMRRLNCIATGNVFPNNRTHHCRMSTHPYTNYTKEFSFA